MANKKFRFIFVIAIIVLIVLIVVVYYIKQIPVQEASPFAPCDLNTDGIRDRVDEQLFYDAFGKCRGDSGYSFNADIDGDGCVSTMDESYFKSCLGMKD